MSLFKKKNRDREREREQELEEELRSREREELLREEIIEERMREKRLRQRQREARLRERDKLKKKARLERLGERNVLSRSNSACLRTTRNIDIDGLSDSFRRCHIYDGRPQDIMEIVNQVQEKAMLMTAISTSLRNRLDSSYAVPSTSSADPNHDTHLNQLRYDEGPSRLETEYPQPSTSQIAMRTDFQMPSCSHVSQSRNIEGPSSSKSSSKTRKNSRPSQGTQTPSICEDENSEPHGRIITQSGPFVSRVVSFKNASTCMSDDDSSASFSEPEQSKFIIPTIRVSPVDLDIERPSCSSFRDERQDRTRSLSSNLSPYNYLYERDLMLSSYRRPYRYQGTSIEATLKQSIKPTPPYRNQISSEESSSSRYECSYKDYQSGQHKTQFKNRRKKKIASEHCESDDEEDSTEDTDHILNLCKRSSIKSRSRESMTFPRRTKPNVRSSSAKKGYLVRRTQNINEPGPSNTSQNFQDDCSLDIDKSPSVEETLELLRELEEASKVESTYLNQLVEHDHYVEQRFIARQSTTDSTMGRENTHLPSNSVCRESTSLNTQCDDGLEVTSNNSIPPSGSEPSQLNGNNNVNSSEETTTEEELPEETSSKDSEKMKSSNIIQDGIKVCESVHSELSNSQSEENEPSSAPSNRPHPPNSLNLKNKSKPQDSSGEGPSQDPIEANNYRSNIEIVDMSPIDKIPYVDRNEEFSVNNNQFSRGSDESGNVLSRNSSEVGIADSQSLDQEYTPDANITSPIPSEEIIKMKNNINQKYLMPETSSGQCTSTDKRLIPPDLNSTTDSTIAELDSSIKNIKLVDDSTTDFTPLNTTTSNDLERNIEPETRENTNEQNQSYLSCSPEEELQLEVAVAAEIHNDYQVNTEHPVHTTNEQQENEHQIPDVDGSSQNYYQETGHANDQNQEPNNDANQHIDFNQYHEGQEDITQTGYNFDQTNPQQYHSEYPEQYFYPNTEEQAYEAVNENNVNYPQEPNEYITEENNMFGYQTNQYEMDPSNDYAQQYYYSNENWEHQNMQYTEGYEPQQADQGNINAISSNYNDDQKNTNYDSNNQIFEYGIAQSVASNSAIETPSLQPDDSNTVVLTQPRFDSATDKIDDKATTSNAKEPENSNKVTEGETEKNTNMSESDEQKDPSEKVANEESSEIILSNQKESENEWIKPLTSSPLNPNPPLPGDISSNSQQSPTGDHRESILSNRKESENQSIKEPSTSSTLNPNQPLPVDISSNSRQSPTGESKIQNVISSQDTIFETPVEAVSPNSDEEKHSETTEVAKIVSKPGNDNQKPSTSKKGTSEPNTKENTKLKSTVKRDPAEKKGGNQTIKKSSSRPK